MEVNNICPNCGSNEFISSLNKYDIVVFDDSEFKFVKSELADIEEEYFCRECGEKVDVEKSVISNKIQLSI